MYSKQNKMNLRVQEFLVFLGHYNHLIFGDPLEEFKEI